SVPPHSGNRTRPRHPAEALRVPNEIGRREHACGRWPLVCILVPIVEYVERRAGQVNKRVRSIADPQSGRSLLEMLVVMMLVALAALLVLPSVSRAMARHRADDGARQIESLLQLARMRAISEQQEYVVQFSAR